MSAGHPVPPGPGRSLPDPRPLLDTLSEHAFLLDADLRLVYVNRSLRETGLSGDVTGRHLFEVFPNSPQSRLAALAPHVLATGEPQQYESRTPNTRQDLSVQLSRYGDLLLVRYTDVSDTVRERRRAEGLHQLTSRLSGLLDPAAIARVILETTVPLVDAYRAAVFTYTPGFEALELVDEVGYTPEERPRYGRLPRDPTKPAPSAVAAGRAVYLQDELDRAFGGTLPPSPRTRAMAALPLLDDGKAFGVLVISFDQPQPFGDTDRRFMESLAAECASALGRARLVDSLRLEQSRLRALTDAVAQVVWWAAADGTVVTPSPSWLRFSGQTAEQSLGQGWIAAIHPDDHAFTLAAWNRAYATGELYDVHHRVRRHDGAYRHMHVRGVPVRDEAGRIREWVGLDEDVTDRVIAQQELRRWAETLEQRVEARTDELRRTIRQLEAETDALESLADFLEAAARHTDPGRLAGQATRMLAEVIEDAVRVAWLERDGGRWWVAHTAPPPHEDEAEEVALPDEALQARLHEGEPLFEDGGPRVARGLAPVLVDGRLHGLLVIEARREDSWPSRERDIVRAVARALALVAERVTHDRRLAEKSARLQVLNEELDAFAESVSHDLRTPLRHIRGFVDLLDRAHGRHDDATVDQYVRHIRDAADGMGSLIDALLEFARQAQAPLRLANVDLDRLVPDLIRSLAPEQGDRQVHWEIGPLPVVRADLQLLRLVFANLLGNALKYTRPRDVAVIRVHADQRDGQHVITVQDNGVGFDPRYAYRLFRPFQRLHRREQFEGTGVGLTSVARIVRRHGGAVRAEGRPEEGATFTVTLPA